MKKWIFIILSIIILTSCASQGKNQRSSAYHKTTTSTPSRSSSSASKSTSSSSSSASNKKKWSEKLGVTVTSSDNQKLYSESASWIGVPYKYGGTSRSGVDCSGFVYLMYQSVYNKSISRQSAAILENNCKAIKQSELREGDLVFFRTDGKNSKTPNHVGIYLKERKFIHASSSKGVVVSSLDNSYYVQNFITAGRVVRENGN